VTVMKAHKINKCNKYKNIVKNAVTNPYYVISIISIILLAYLILVPLWEMISTTFKWQAQDVKLVKGAVAGGITLNYWKSALGSMISKNLFYKPLLNSVVIASLVSVLSIILGGLLAWLLTRTDLPCKKLLAFLTVVPYMLPSWYKAMAWTVIFKNNRIGGYPGFFQSVFNISPPDWFSYGPVPIIITLTLHYYVFTYLLMSSALHSIGGDLEEMAEITGASRFTILRKITFPLVLPAIMSSFILTFSKSIGTFGVPAFLGLKVNYYTLSTMLYSSIRNRNTVRAYILGIVLILVACLTVYLNQRAIGKRKSYTTIGGKGTRKNLIPLRKWRIPILAALFLFIFVAVVLPLAVMVMQSFMLTDGVYSLKNFTTHFWIGNSTSSIADGEAGVFKNKLLWTSILNTMKLVIVVSAVATLIGLILGYIVSRGRKKLSGRIIDQLSFTPYIIPSIAFGAIFLSMFSKPKLFLPTLYGTFGLLVLISVIKYLPFSVRAGTSNMLQIGYELEEAAAIEGSSWIKRFRKIMLPLSKKGLLSGFLLIFISAMKELDLLVLLVTPKTGTLTTLTYSYAESGFQQFSDVIMTVIVFIIIVVYFISLKIGDADISSGMGG
jgi:iron(III) transport system permease protein